MKHESNKELENCAKRLRRRMIRAMAEGGESRFFIRAAFNIKPKSNEEEIVKEINKGIDEANKEQGKPIFGKITDVLIEKDQKSEPI